MTVDYIAIDDMTMRERLAYLAWLLRTNQIREHYE